MSQTPHPTGMSHEDEEEQEEQSPLGNAFLPVYPVQSIEQPCCSHPYGVGQQHLLQTSTFLESARLAEPTIQRIPGEGTL